LVMETVDGGVRASPQQESIANIGQLPGSPTSRRWYGWEARHN